MSEKFLIRVGTGWVTDDGSYGTGTVMAFDPERLTEEQWQTLDELSDDERLGYAMKLAGGEDAAKDKSTSNEKPLIWVGIYNHRFGTDVQLFSTEEKAKAWRTALAKEWWDDAFPDEERPDDDSIGDEYFRLMMDICSEPESFHIETATLDEAHLKI